MNPVLKLYSDNRKTILLTFEVFWIVVFLLNSLLDTSGTEVAQFVYANF
jgi:hypothetical protein